MKKIKVLRIIARLNIGGPAIHTILLTEGLDGVRFDSLLVTGVVDKDEGDMAYFAQAKGVKPIVIPELGRSLNVISDFIAFFKLFSLMMRVKPDIIHTHTAKAGTLGRLAGICYNLCFVKKKCVLVHTFHGHVLHSYFGKVKTAFFVWIERCLAWFTDAIIAVSESVKKDLLCLKIGKSEKVITVPLGLELDRYLKIRKSLETTQEKYTSIGIVGRLVPVKNHKMFLQIAKSLKQIYAPSRKTRFFIVGDGYLRSELEEYAQDLGIAEDVTFVGWARDLEEIYSRLDIAVLTSLNEGTPVALIEAQAAACPCVATNVGGMRDVVEDERSGFLVSPDDKEGFLKALSELVNNPQRARSMGNYGRNRVKDRFSKQQLIKNVETLYINLLRK